MQAVFLIFAKFAILPERLQPFRLTVEWFRKMSNRSEYHEKNHSGGVQNRILHTAGVIVQMFPNLFL